MPPVFRNTARPTSVPSVNRGDGDRRSCIPCYGSAPNAERRAGQCRDHPSLLQVRRRICSSLPRFSASNSRRASSLVTSPRQLHAAAAGLGGIPSPSPRALTTQDPVRLIRGMNLRLHSRSVAPAEGPEKCGLRRPTRNGYSCNNALRSVRRGPISHHREPAPSSRRPVDLGRLRPRTPHSQVRPGQVSRASVPLGEPLDGS